MPRTYEELDLNNKLIWNFRDIGHTMRAISEGKGSQKRVLIVLSEVGAITQSNLTQRLGIQPGSASEVLMKLEGAGMIQRVPSEKDKRTTVVLLTPEGQSEAEKLGCARVERHARMFAALDETEKATAGLTGADQHRLGRAVPTGGNGRSGASQKASMQIKGREKRDVEIHQKVSALCRPCGGVHVF